MSTSPEWRPNAGPQEMFLRSSAHEILYGGAAGGGKTASLVVAPLRWVGHAQFRGLLLRRTVPDLKRSGSIIEIANAIYPGYGGWEREGGRIWRFPSGARIDLGSMERPADRFNYRSSAYWYIGFDELTTFEEMQYVYLISRMRGPPGAVLRLRSGTNPDGPGHDWVLKRWAPWLYPPGHEEYDGQRALPGEKLWFKRASNGVEEIVPPHTQGARSRTFIPALATDNPHLTADYHTGLDMLDPLTRAQLKHGDWMARAAPGAYFKRAWFADKFITDIPAKIVARVRYWDLAATAANDPNATTAAWTAGVRMAKLEDGSLVVEHVVRGQWSPGEVEQIIKSTAESDHRLSTTQVIERDPAQAGKFQAFHFVRMLSGFDVRTVAPWSDKVSRAKPFSAQCEGGNVRIVRGRWNEAYLVELEGFPAGAKDQVDASSGAFSQCTKATGSLARTGGVRPFSRAQGGF